MIPVRLRLRNFLCYRDLERLDFTGIHLACLSGENGHGKSAILDAMTWALWGKARAGTDELIHFNETEMEVEFEFLLEDSLYRVIRKRTKRGRNGQSVLELQAEVDGSFHPLTETSIRQTQARIDELLRMDYDTFINSAFLLQGRADEFTTKTPMQRKEILADILGLSIYDQYETRAKEKAREQDTQAKVLSSRIEEWEKELALRSEYEQQLAEAEAQVSQVTGHLEEINRHVQELRQERHNLDSKRAQSQELRDRAGRMERELADLKQRLQTGQADIANYERVLTQRERIERGYDDLVKTRRRNEQLNLQLQELMNLNRRKSDLERQIDTERQKLLMEKRRLEDRLADLQQKALGRERCEAELRQMEVPFENLARVEADLKRFREDRSRQGEESARSQAYLEQLRIEVQETGEKRAQLSTAEAQCPLCGSELSEEHRRQLLAEMESGIQDNERSIQKAEARIAELAQTNHSLESEIHKAEKQLTNLPRLHERKAKLEAALEEAARAAEELELVQPQLGELIARFQAAEWAGEVRSQLREVQQEIDRVGYNESLHQETRAAADKLAPFEDERSRLLTAQENLKHQREHVESLRQLEESRQQELISVQKEEETLGGELQRWDDCLAELAQAEEELTRLQTDASHARLNLGAARQKLDTSNNLEKMRDEKLIERKEALYEKAVYDELRLAFSKRGLQAMIIEHIIPEIEDEANAILFRMTDGRMQVQLDTQRETKSKDVVEALDITVSDELGPRAYELYSGGEAFRINFALRVALSKLLARRAGASLRTLIIDEGFGTQDAQGRERLIESINAIQQDFDKVLVITHIDELRDAFPVHIEVFKTMGGSQIKVS